MRYLSFLVLFFVAHGTYAQAIAGKSKDQRSAKVPPKSRPNAGVVSGRIFAITKAGDIKPARMAKVYLFSWGGHADEVTAGSIWSNEKHRLLVEFLKEKEQTDAGGWVGLEDVRR